MDWEKVLDQFETGEVRAANKIDGKWVANKEAKQAILAAFKAGELKEFSDTGFRGFVDKHNLPAREFKPENKIRKLICAKKLFL